MNNTYKENKIEMVMFDLDGTLWETEEISYQIANEVMKKNGLTVGVSREVIASTMGCSFEETAERYMPYLDKQQREIILQEVLDTTSERLAIIGGNVYEGLEKVLLELKKKYKLAIVSNCGAGYIEAFLESSHLEKYFDDFAAAAKMKVTKAEAIKTVVGRNNIKKAVYVGDTIKDMEASQGAEMLFIQAKYGFGEDLKTDYSINEISELPEKLNEVKDEV